MGSRTVEKRSLDILTKVSHQVAHDIRSPLAAFDILLNDLSQIPEENRTIARMAVNRIKDIANNLIEKNQEIKNSKHLSPLNLTNESTSVQLLWSIIDPMITEKRMEYRTRIGIEIDGVLSGLVRHS